MTGAIPRADLLAQHEAIAAEVRAAVERVMASGRYVLGPEVEAFESEFAAYCGAAHCVGTNSGTDALRFAVSACGLDTGDEVVTVALTAPATAFAIELAGAAPRFADVDPERCTLDPGAAAAAIGASTRALLPVHLYGQCADMGLLRRIAEERGLWLIEDAAQAHGAAYGGRRVGTLGHVACFSFYPTKNLGAYGDGGAVVTDDPELARRVRLLRDYGRTAETRHETVAGNSRLDELQAAILRVKLRRLDQWNERRRRHAERYRELMADLPLELPAPEDREQHVFHLYVVRTPRRDALRAHLAENGVATGVHFPVPVHRQPAYGGRDTPELPVTDACADEVLSLPMYPELGDADLERVADLAREFFADAHGASARARRYSS
jgi:dTDP-4-amino-4,6-dideoxygalactose transaminase